MKINVRPPDQTIRHTFELSRDEIIVALKKYIADQGESIPEGKTFLWGLEQMQPDHEENLTLVVDVQS